jgi:hypothetical protein
MITDLMIIPNFFDKPQEILDIAKKQIYYPVSEHPNDANTKIRYGGKRTLELSGKKEAYVLNETFYKKVIVDTTCNDAQIKFEWYGEIYFHYFENDYFGGNPELHQDSALMAGVIYLNPYPLSNPERHGTIIFNKDNQRFTMPYVYNTLIMYKSDFYHAPLAGFGNSVDNSRLSMIFSIDKFTLDVSRNTLK